jgi:hypothetical protein
VEANHPGDDLRDGRRRNEARSAERLASQGHQFSIMEFRCFDLLLATLFDLQICSPVCEEERPWHGISKIRQIRTERFQNHPGMHVIQFLKLREMGFRQSRGQAHFAQSCSLRQGAIHPGVLDMGTAYLSSYSSR